MDIDFLIKQCREALPCELKDKPWTILNHGYDVLDCDDKLNAYIAAYGEMHLTKCRIALQNFPFDEFAIRDRQGEVTQVYRFEIFDWGCGQGLGTLALLESLSERKMLHAVSRITLIEPSAQALRRAENWVRQSTQPNTHIRCFNRFIPGNENNPWSDIDCNTGTAIHICSNILDIRSVGLRWLAKTTSSLASTSIYVCVGPQYGGGKSRINDFYNLLGESECFSDFYRFPCAYTSLTNHPYGVEVKCFKKTGTIIDTSYIEQSTQQHEDEYQAGDECLKGIISDSVISAYHNLMKSKSTDSTFDLFLRPTIGIEHPDFILMSPEKGFVIVNVCDDITNFNDIFFRTESIKRTFFDIYLKSLKIDSIKNRALFNSVKTAIFFTNATSAEISSARTEYYNNLRINKEDTPIERLPKDPTRYLVIFTQADNTERIRQINTPKFSIEYYKELRSMIFSNWHPYSSGDNSFILTQSQKSFIEETNTRLRIKGVAGSGKTQIVAYKAVKEHLRTGTKVLIVTFNISLIEYIKMRIEQVPASFSKNAFEIINYHQFFMSKAKKYVGRVVDFNNINHRVFFDSCKETIIRENDQYDTIIVDEAQDFMSEWFDCLRVYFLKENGRFILVGDGTQNIYKREQEADSKMPRVNGFEGHRWREMNDRISMRQRNPQIASLASAFANYYQLSDQTLSTQQLFNIYNYYCPLNHNVVSPTS